MVSPMCIEEKEIRFAPLETLELLSHAITGDRLGDWRTTDVM